MKELEKNNAIKVNWYIRKIVIAILVSVFIIATAFILEYYVFKYPVTFTTTRLFIYGSIELFVLFNIFYDYKKIWN